MNLLIIVTDIIEKLVLLGLLGLSVWSMAIIIDRQKNLRRVLQAQTEDVLQYIQKSNWTALQSLSESSLVVRGVQSALGTQSANPEIIERQVSGFIKTERAKMESGLVVLATLGSNAPFVGLFGTVLGIIRAFAYLSAQSNPAAVMSGVSQALYATAIGLFVAIPAVVAFNYFNSSIKKSIMELESCRDLLIAQKLKESVHGG